MTTEITETTEAGGHMTTISTHILDTARGRPAAGVPVTLEVHRDGAWQHHAVSATDEHGRIAGWPPLAADPPAACRLVFAVRDYLLSQHGVVFFPEVAVAFTPAPGQHYHLPLLLTPFGYSVYRGS